MNWVGVGVGGTDLREAFDDLALADVPDERPLARGGRSDTVQVSRCP